MHPDTRHTVIERLRLTGSRDPLLERGWTEAALGVMDLELRQLPRHALFVVRHLRAPSTWISAGGLDITCLRAAEAALRSRLEALLQQAARPAQGAVPAHAQAVLFQDRSEWLACLASDVLQRRYSDAWWWAALRRRAPGPEVVRETWRAHAEHVPAAIAQLARASLSRQLSTLIHGRAAQELLRAIAERHALPHLHLRLDGSSRSSARHGADERREPSAEAQAWQPIGALPASQQAWPRRASESSRQAPPELAALGGELPQRDAHARALVLTSLCLLRWPARARSEAFAAQLADWLEQAHATRVIELPSLAPSVEPSPPRASSTKAEQSEAPRLRWSRPTPHAVTHTHHLTWQAAPAEARTPLAPQARPAAGNPAHGNSAAAAVAAEREAMATRDSTLPAPVVDAGSSPAAIEALDARPSTAEADTFQTEAAAAFETRQGGVFFLVWVAVELGIYADFSSPRSPGIELPIGDFLELVARALAPESDRNDPIWSFLAALSGRPADEPPGNRFAPPARWRIPATWLEAFDPIEQIECQEVGARVRALHPLGFPLLDLPAHGLSLSEVQAELGSDFASATLVWGRPEPGTSLPLERWTHWITSYLRARLALALACPVDSVAPLLLERPARVRATAAHLEVILSLAEHPIQIRSAGLDRDPGWVPALSRYLVFRFEEGPL